MDYQLIANRIQYDPIAQRAAKSIKAPLVELVAGLVVKPGESQMPHEWGFSAPPNLADKINRQNFDALQHLAILVWLHSPGEAGDGFVTHRMRAGSYLQGVRIIEQDRQKMAAVTGGRAGGKRGKRSNVVEIAAKRLAQEAEGMNKEQAWAKLPPSYNPWEIETDEYDLRVYVDGGKLVIEDAETLKTLGEQSKSNFLKRYYPPAGQ